MRASLPVCPHWDVCSTPSPGTPKLFITTSSLPEPIHMEPLQALLIMPQDGSATTVIRTANYRIRLKCSPPPATPFTSLLDQFIDIPATLTDPMHLSTPRIQSTPRTDIASIPLEAELEPRPLLNYLHHQLHEHFSRLQASQTTHCCFVTFIVGPSTHPSASTALHSHLVSAFTAPPNEAHSILYYPLHSDRSHYRPTSLDGMAPPPGILGRVPTFSSSLIFGPHS